MHIVDMGIARSRTPWEWQSLPHVKFRELAKPPSGLCTDVDGVCKTQQHSLFLPPETAPIQISHPNYLTSPPMLNTINMLSFWVL